MKKISAMIIALMMTCMAFTSCGGSEESSSKADESTASDTTASASGEQEADGEEQESDGAVVEGATGDLAKNYTEKINSGEYTADLTITSDYLGEIPYVITVKDGNFYVKMSAMGVNVEYYSVDGTVYMLMPDAQMYSIEEDVSLEDMGIDTFGIDDSYTYVETKEDGDYTVEVYSAVSMETEDEEADDESLSDTVSYYFDSEGELKKITSSSDYMGNTTVEINSIAYEVADDIVLPDLTDWVEMSDDTELDDASAMKLSLSMFGITEEDVTSAGYTYEQLAEMEDEELMTVLEELGVDLSEIYGTDYDDESDGETADSTEE